MTSAGLLLSVLVALGAAGSVLLWAAGPRPGVGEASELTTVSEGLEGLGGLGGLEDLDGRGIGPDGAVPPDSASTLRERARQRVRQLRRRRTDRLRDRELQVLDGLSAALEAGLPVPQAVTLAVSRVQQPGVGDRPETGWDELARAASQGQALAPVWQRLARRSGSPTLSSVARAWRVATLTGAPLARAVRVSAHVSRERRRLERAVQVATAGARATVTVLTLLPLAGVGLAAVLGVSPTSLYAHPVALASAGAGVVLVLVGQVWSRRMVTRVLRGAT